MIFPWPQIYGLRQNQNQSQRIAITVAMVSYVYDGFSPGYVRAPDPGNVTGGSLSPDALSGATIRAIQAQVIGPAFPGTRYLVFVIDGSVPADFFTSISVPGVNGGAPLLAASAEFVSPDSRGNSRWRWPGVTGDVENGFLEFT